MKQFVNHAQRQVLAGLILLVPFAVTILVTVFLYRIIDRFVGPLVDQLLLFWPLSMMTGQRDIVAFSFRLLLSILTTLMLLYFAGFVSTTIVMHEFYMAGEQLVLRIPFVKTVYGTTKQLLQLITTRGGGRFKRMAMVEFPRAGMLSIGFVTGETRFEGDPRRYISVFVPKVPNPTAGFVLIVPEDQVRILNIGIEEGIKMIMSGGVIIPRQMTVESFTEAMGMDADGKSEGEAK